MLRSFARVTLQYLLAIIMKTFPEFVKITFKSWLKNEGCSKCRMGKTNQESETKLLYKFYLLHGNA